MPIKSYLAYARKDRYQDMIRDLSAFPWAEVHASDAALAVLLTDTADEEEERRVCATLAALEPIDCLALVYGHSLEEPIVC